MGPVVGKAVSGESVGSGVMTSGSLGDVVGSKETGALFGELDG